MSNVITLQKLDADGKPIKGKTEAIKANGKLGAKADLIQVTADKLNIDDAINPENRVARAGNVEEMAKALVMSGQITPIRAYKEGTKLFVLDGHRRLAGFNHAIEAELIDAKTPINVVVVSKPKPGEAALETLASNNGAHMHPLEQGELFYRAKKEGATIAEIVAKTSTGGEGSTTRSTVSNWIILARLPAGVRDKVSVDQLGAYDAVEMTRMLTKASKKEGVTPAQKKALAPVPIIKTAWEHAEGAGRRKIKRGDIAYAIAKVVGVPPKAEKAKSGPSAAELKEGIEQAIAELKANHPARKILEATLAGTLDEESEAA